MTAEEQSVKTIAFVLYRGMTPFDLVGPLQVLTRLSEIAPQYRTVVVGERVEPTDNDLHVKLIPNKAFEEVPHPAVFVVPGGVVPTFQAMSNGAIRGYVLSATETAETVASVCTGALILASVGLLEGRKATTHWACRKILEDLGATYLRRRWVEDCKFICSAGVSAGIDMALQLSARLTNVQTARQVQLALGYDPEPPFGGIDYDHLGLRGNAFRAGMSLASPVVTFRPKRLTRLGR